MMPYAEDSAVCRVAEETGMVMSRYEAVEITDEKAISAAGLTLHEARLSADQEGAA